MNPPAVIRRMDTFPRVIQAACSALTPDEARYKPISERWPKGAWSVLEIVCHLVDEERDDFRARLRAVLDDPATPWPNIDPEGWAASRGYLERDLAEMVERLAKERAESIAWLKGLDEPDWTASYVHPKLGPIRAGDLLVAWAAHDALHLRQIAKRLHELASRDAPEFSPAYAGAWGA